MGGFRFYNLQHLLFWTCLVWALIYVLFVCRGKYVSRITDEVQRIRFYETHNHLPFNWLPLDWESNTGRLVITTVITGVYFGIMGVLGFFDRFQVQVIIFCLMIEWALFFPLFYLVIAGLGLLTFLLVGYQLAQYKLHRPFGFKL